jgi:hypothetical protein
MPNAAPAFGTNSPKVPVHAETEFLLRKPEAAGFGNKRGPDRVNKEQTK